MVCLRYRGSSEGTLEVLKRTCSDERIETVGEGASSGQAITEGKKRGGQAPESAKRWNAVIL